MHKRYLSIKNKQQDLPIDNQKQLKVKKLEKAELCYTTICFALTRCISWVLLQLSTQTCQQQNQKKKKNYNKSNCSFVPHKRISC